MANTTKTTVPAADEKIVRVGPFVRNAVITDGKLVSAEVVAVNADVVRADGENIVNLPAVAKRLGDELRNGEAYSVQRIRALIAHGWLGLHIRNIGDEEAPIMVWYVADGRDGRRDTIAEYIAAVNTNKVFTRAAGGSITVSKLPDTLVTPDGYTVPAGATLADVIAAFAAANNVRYTDRATSAAATTDATSAAAEEAPTTDAAA